MQVTRPRCRAVRGARMSKGKVLNQGLPLAVTVRWLMPVDCAGK